MSTTTSGDAVQGFAEPGYGRVADAFTAAVASSPRGGAALSIRVGGQSVVNLWGGTADPARGRRWTEDTSTVLFSCSKGLLAVLVARLVEDGRLDLDAPVTRYWPEFGQAGKEAVPVRWLLSHRAGLAYPVEDITKADVLAWEPVVAKLAAQAPLWALGGGWAYHTLTYGWLVGEVVERVTGQAVGQAFQQWVAAPAGAAAWFGVPVDLAASVAKIAAIPGFTEDLVAGLPDETAFIRSATLGGAFPIALVGDGTGFDDPDIQAAAVPGAGAVATAAALADIWSTTVVPTSNTQPLQGELIADMTARQTFGPPVYGLEGGPTAWWATGFQIDAPDRPFLTPSSFGHDGAGGQLGFADPDIGIGFGFVTNDMQAVGDTRSLDILTALRITL